MYICHICNQDEADVMINKLNMAVEIKKSHKIPKKPKSKIGNSEAVSHLRIRDVLLRKNSCSFGHCLN